MVNIVKDDVRRLRMRLSGRAGVAIKPGVASEQQRAAERAYGEISRRSQRAMQMIDLPLTGGSAQIGRAHV